MVGVGRAHSLTGVQAQYGHFRKVPKEFVDELGEEKAQKLTKYVKELAEGDDGNLNKLIDLLEEAEGEIPDKELMTLINEINDFIVPNQQSGTSKSKLKIQKKFQDKVIDSSTLDDLIDKLDDPKTASGDSLSAFIKDFQTERLETLTALNKDDIANELKKIKAGESTDQDKLKELIAVAGDVYGSDADKAQMINDVLSGFKGLDYNVKAISGGKVSEVEDHNYTHRGGAAGDDGEIATRVAEWVEVGNTSDDDDDSFSSSSSSRSRSRDRDFSYIPAFKRQVEGIDRRRERANERRIANHYHPHRHIQYVNSHGDHNRHWATRTPWGLYTGGPAWRPQATNGGIMDYLGGNFFKPFFDAYSLFGGVYDAFNGNLSRSLYSSPHGIHHEVATVPSYQKPYYHGDPYLTSLYGQTGQYGAGTNNQITFNPTIEVSPIISNNSNSSSHPYVNTNTPVNTFVPNHNAFRPNIAGYNSQFPFVYS
ncbi:MAG: hypothetical protein HRT47_12875 [Candidatus Caenarcaniphilales bacterium]|nr:hypothetical protein [Candidatus Caenarcaniphilales bacterium]